MKLIPLTRGEFAMVDDADYDWLNKYNWWVHVSRGQIKYAKGWIDGRKALMHRLILGITDPRQHTDHRDGNGLNNQRRNVRLVSHRQNHMNRHRAYTGASSPFKGVSWHDPRNKWQAYIKKDGKHYHLGLFRFEVDAAWAYDLAARDLFGEHACFNFPGPGEQGVVFPDDIPKEAFLSARVMS